MKLPGMFSRLWERRDFAATHHPYVAELLGALRTSSGASVSPGAAEGLATVSACVQAIGSAVASLPAYVYRASDAGRIEDTAHSINRLIRQGPNLA